MEGLQLLTAVKEMWDWQMQPQNIASGGIAFLRTVIEISFHGLGKSQWIHKGDQTALWFKTHGFKKKQKRNDPCKVQVELDT